MRTPRLFLGIFALALRLPLLLLACGGSGELTGGRSSGRATAGPTTEVAEPSPTLRATARPPLVQTSPETDREALIALYNATGGPNWSGNYNWLSDVPISEWEGVTTDGNGRVIGLALLGEPVDRGDTAGTGQPRQPDRVVPQREPVERGDTAGVGQPRQPDTAGPQRERVERGDTAGVGQPPQPDRVVPQQERVERGDTAGVGQPRQPDRVVPQQERVERGDTRRSWATSPT